MSKQGNDGAWIEVIGRKSKKQAAEEANLEKLRTQLGEFTSNRRREGETSDLSEDELDVVPDTPVGAQPPPQQVGHYSPWMRRTICFEEEPVYCKEDLALKRIPSLNPSTEILLLNETDHVPIRKNWETGCAGPKDTIRQPQRQGATASKRHTYMHTRDRGGATKGQLNPPNLHPTRSNHVRSNTVTQWRATGDKTLNGQHNVTKPTKEDLQGQATTSTAFAKPNRFDLISEEREQAALDNHSFEQTKAACIEGEPSATGGARKGQNAKDKDLAIVVLGLEAQVDLIAEKALADGAPCVNMEKCGNSRGRDLRSVAAAAHSRVPQLDIESNVMVTEAADLELILNKAQELDVDKGQQGHSGKPKEREKSRSRSRTSSKSRPPPDHWEDGLEDAANVAQ